MAEVARSGLRLLLWLAAGEGTTGPLSPLSCTSPGTVLGLKPYGCTWHNEDPRTAKQRSRIPRSPVEGEIAEASKRSCTGARPGFTKCLPHNVQMGARDRRRLRLVHRVGG